MFFSFILSKSLETQHRAYRVSREKPLQEAFVSINKYCAITKGCISARAHSLLFLCEITFANLKTVLLFFFIQGHEGTKNCLSAFMDIQRHLLARFTTTNQLLLTTKFCLERVIRFNFNPENFKRLFQFINISMCYIFKHPCETLVYRTIRSTIISESDAERDLFNHHTL